MEKTTSIKDTVISTVLSFFGIDDKEADAIKGIIEQFEFEETEDRITVTCKKGITVSIEK